MTNCFLLLFFDFFFGGSHITGSSRLATLLHFYISTWLIVRLPHIYSHFPPWVDVCQIWIKEKYLPNHSILLVTFQSLFIFLFVEILALPLSGGADWVLVIPFRIVHENIWCYLINYDRLIFIFLFSDNLIGTIVGRNNLNHSSLLSLL